MLLGKFWHSAFQSMLAKSEQAFSTLSNRLPSSPLSRASVSPPPSWNQRGGQHSFAGEGRGGANSDDWRESLALCLLCGDISPCTIPAIVY
jgi:hypothetical protein